VPGSFEKIPKGLWRLRAHRSMPSRASFDLSGSFPQHPPRVLGYCIEVYRCQLFRPPGLSLVLAEL